MIEKNKKTRKNQHQKDKPERQERMLNAFKKAYFRKDKYDKVSELPEDVLCIYTELLSKLS